MDPVNAWLGRHQELALPIFAALFGGFILVAVLAWLRSRRDEAARAEELRLAGLAPAELPAALAQRLRLLDAPRRASAFRNVWSARYSDGELYMLDLWDTGGDSSAMTAQGLVVFVSPRLALPRLHVMPRLESLGWFGRLAGPLLGRLLDWGAGRQGLARVDFPDDPGLESRFLVHSDDPARARAFLGASRGLWLAQLPAALLWEGQGDLLCVRSWDWTAKPGLPAPRALENARALYSVLTR